MQKITEMVTNTVKEYMKYDHTVQNNMSTLLMNSEVDQLYFHNKVILFVIRLILLALLITILEKIISYLLYTLILSYIIFSSVSPFINFDSTEERRLNVRAINNNTA